MCLRSSEGPSPQSAHGRPKTSPRRPTTRPKCSKDVPIPLPYHPRHSQDSPGPHQGGTRPSQDAPRLAQDPPSLCQTCPESSPRTLSRCAARSLSRCAPKSLGGTREAKTITHYCSTFSSLNYRIIVIFSATQFGDENVDQECVNFRRHSLVTNTSCKNV
jgi:hypothetical protein